MESFGKQSFGLYQPPVPLKETDCEPAEALSVIVRFPVNITNAVGVKVTEMEQLEPGPNCPGQVSVS